MKILILPDREAAVAACVDLIAQTLTATPDAVLGLATGGTMEPVYAGLLARARAGEVTLNRMTSFNLDEYVGLPPGHPQSYHTYMRERLFGPLGLDPALVARELELGEPLPNSIDATSARDVVA